ncbi:diguanylate cyclase [Anaerotalea alkaliphila]|uniref:Stage 0 sporulation protein A homolog n=1 Tax=Anaerotalea alkaliphila TaxID=2662126 RepID=A0A7X5KMR0_9FIRM|nr:diguanylate cyclase [Anaerotalea alkaliphila]NDL67229.1 diguanylate cyclase [Anaerotalea alkaliphila]
MEFKSQKAIICVDDDPYIVNQLEESFNNHLGDEYIIEVAESANELLDIIRSLEEIKIETAVIVSDYLMPRINGVELIDIINKKYPFIKIILLTGNMNMETLENAINSINIYRFIKKPWEEEHLLRTVREAAELHRQEKELDDLHERLKKSEWEKRLILDSISEALFYMDTDLKVLWSNDMAKDFLGREPEGLHCHEIFHAISAPCPDCCAKRTLEGETQLTKEIILEDGRHLFLRFYAVMERDQSRGVVLAVQDITNRKRVEHMNQALLHLARSNNSIHTIHMLYDNAYHVLASLLHVKSFLIAGHVEGKVLAEYVQGAGMEESFIRELIQETDAGIREPEGYHLRREGKGIHYVQPLINRKYMLLHFSPNGYDEALSLQLASAVAEQLSGSMVNIYHLDRITYQANHDALTGLFNRKYLLQRLEGLHQRKRNRDGGEAHNGLAIIDLNRFKSVNDNHGHVAGDQVLRMVAAKMLEATRHEDVLARIGGDEFALLFTIDSEEAARTMLERIREALYEEMQVGDDVLRLGGCLGVALFEGADWEPVEVFKHADEAMYRAKEMGKEEGCVLFFEEGKTD